MTTKKQPTNQPALFTYDLHTGEIETPQPQDTALMKCALGLQKFTGFDLPTSVQCVLAIIIAALTGCGMTIGGHRIRCSSVYIFTAYNSAVRLMLDFAAAIFWAIREVGGRERASTFEELCAHPAQPYFHRVVVGTEGPFRSFSPKALPALDRVAAAVRGRHGDECPHVTTLWAGGPGEVILAAEAGRSAGFASLATIIAIESMANTLPVALQSIRELELFNLIAAPCTGIAERGLLDFSFSPEAETMILAAVQGRAFWLDDVRKIGSIGAAYNVALRPQVPTFIDAATAGRAIEHWRQNEATMSTLLGNAPARAAAVVDDLAARAQRILDYCVRTGLSELSPRDVVLHALAEKTADAVLLLAYLETKGLAKQIRFIHNGRPLQKWEVNTPRIPPPSEDEDTEEPGGTAPKAPLTSPTGDGAALAVAVVEHSEALTNSATGGNVQ